MTKGGGKIMSRGKGWMIACMMLALAVLGLAGGQTAHAEAITYADGQYQVPFQVLKDTSDEISATSDYVEGTAEIHIEHGKIQALLTLKNSSWWQEFKVQSHAGQAYTDVVTVSEDAERQTSVVTFPIDDLSRAINGKIHIIVTGIPGFEYDHQYDIRLKFDASGIPVSTQPATASESSGANAEPGITPPAKPEASSPSVQETSAKPAEAESTQDRQVEASEPQKQMETADQGASPAGGGGEAAEAAEADAADPGQESGDAIEEEATPDDEAGELPDGEETLAPADAAEESESAPGGAPWILIAIGALLVIVAAVAATIWFRRPRKVS